MGGLFERLTKLSPAAQQLVDLKKQQLEKEAEGIRKQIADHRDAQIARMNSEHQARMAPIEASIADRKREMADMAKSAMLGAQCSRLMVGLLGPLTDGLRRGGVPDMRGAMRGLHGEIEKQTDTFKQQPTNEVLQKFESWALERAGDGAEKVRSEFKAFRERRAADGIALG